MNTMIWIIAHIGNIIETITRMGDGIWKICHFGIPEKFNSSELWLFFQILSLWGIPSSDDRKMIWLWLFVRFSFIIWFDFPSKFFIIMYKGVTSVNIIYSERLFRSQFLLLRKSSNTFLKLDSDAFDCSFSLTTFIKEIE